MRLRSPPISAVSFRRAALERLERANRESERAARDAYLGVQSEMSRVQALQQALKSNQTALQATEAGFEVGTRTTVDVLDSRRRLFEAQTNYSRSRYDYLLNVLKLQQATGSLDRKDLETHFEQAETGLQQHQNARRCQRL